ncbi:MAG: hypothetical protein E7402_03295 [Ruminococcaceae bacterium]|nr:hypothetical protein [Oscillospiraceae bacterium]
MMRLRNRVVSLLTALIMLSSSLAVFAADEPPEAVIEGGQTSPKGEIYVMEDFEAYQDGGTKITGFNVGDKGNVCGIRVIDGNKSVMLTTDGITDSMLDCYLPEVISGNIVVEQKVYVPAFSGTEHGIWLRDGNGKDVEFVRIFDRSVSFDDGTVISGLAPKKFYTLALVLDFERHVYDVYFNDKKRVNDRPFTDSFNDLKQIRWHLRMPKAAGVWHVDDIRIYQSDKPMTLEELSIASGANGETSGGDNVTTESTIRSTVGNAVAMFMGKSNVLNKTVKGYISEDRSIVPQWRGEQALVPAEYFVKSLEGTMTENAAENSVTVTKGDKTVKLFYDKSRMIANGVEMVLGAPATKINGVAYLPIYEVADALGIYLFLDADLLIYSEDQLGLSWNKDLKALRLVSEAFVFDDATGAEIIAMVKEKHPNNGHPRLIMTEEKFQRIRDELAKGENGDPVYRKIVSQMKVTCDDLLDQPPFAYIQEDGLRLNTHVPETRVTQLALMYNITGDERYAERAKVEMIAYCSYIDWNPHHFLDTGVMCSGMALAYDWLYNWLPDYERKLVRDSIVEKAIHQVANDYRGLTRNSGTKEDLLCRTWNWSSGQPVNNWRFVAGGGVAIGALAVCDEVTGEDLAVTELCLERSLLGIRPVISLFAPDGAYEEGLLYWDYAGQYYQKHISALKTATGTDLGYFDVPGLSATNDFVLGIMGSTSNWAFHDTGFSDSASTTATYTAYAAHFKDLNSMRARYDSIMRGGGSYRDLIHYDPDLDYLGTSNTSAFDSVLQSAGTFTTRSGWGENEIFTGLHADGGPAVVDHGHADAGSFVLDSQGVSWFFDLGRDDYNLPNYNRDCYMHRAEGHNGLVINPGADQYGGYDMCKDGISYLEKSETKPLGAFAIGNVTDAWRADAESARRGVKLDNNRRTVTVQDEVVLKKPVDVYWLAHTKAEIKISEDGKKAYLSQNGKMLLAEIAQGPEDAVFTVGDAVSDLPGAPDLPGQASTEGIKELTIHLENCEKLDLMVVFNDYDLSYDESSYSKKWVALDDWSIPDGEINLRYATVDSITVNGQPVEGFDPEVRKYVFSVNPSLDDSIPVIAATSSDGEVIITPPAGPVGTATVKVVPNNGKAMHGYELVFNATGSATIPDGLTEIKPVGVKASSVPQPENTPENTLDGNLETKWACLGVNWIEYDLGRVYNVNTVALAFMDSLKRVAQFSIEVSVDGSNYVQVFDGDTVSVAGFGAYTAGDTPARYVRVTCKGHSHNQESWSSLLDFRAYRK